MVKQRAKAVMDRVKVHQQGRKRKAKEEPVERVQTHNRTMTDQKRLEEVKVKTMKMMMTRMKKEEVTATIKTMTTMMKTIRGTRKEMEQVDPAERKRKNRLITSQK